MARGGRRNGTPGKAYSNRSDLMGQGQRPGKGGYGPQQGTRTTAAGGRTAPAGPPMTPPGPGVDDTPFLGDPTNLPDQPLTDGLATGPGAGPEALTPNVPTASQRILKYLPEFERIAAQPDTPDTFKALVTYLQGER